MDFMFEDEVDEVGSDVEAYCPKCKADTTHVVISKYEDEIRRVQCNPCGDVHSYRKPRGEVEDDVPEPIAAKKRALMKKQNWEEFFTKYPERHGKPYEFREAYSENTIVTHPKFGKGFVSELLSDSKVEVTFKDARRVLVHNRKDMPGLPLAAEGDGIPSKGPKAKAVKSKAAAAKEAVAPLAVVPPVAGSAHAGKPAAVSPSVAGQAMPAGGAPPPTSPKGKVTLASVKSPAVAPPTAAAKVPAAPPVTASAAAGLPAKVTPPGKSPAPSGKAAAPTPTKAPAKGPPKTPPKNLLTTASSSKSAKAAKPKSKAAPAGKVKAAAAKKKR